MIMPGYKLIREYRKDGKSLKEDILSASLALFVVYFLSICNVMCVKLMEVFCCLQAWKRASKPARAVEHNATFRA